MELRQLVTELDGVIADARKAYDEADAARKAGKSDEYNSKRADFMKLKKVSEDLREDIKNLETIAEGKGIVDKLREPADDLKTGDSNVPDNEGRQLPSARMKIPANFQPDFKQVLGTTEIKAQERGNGVPYLAHEKAEGQGFTVRNVSALGFFRAQAAKALMTSDDGSGGIFMLPDVQPGIIDTTNKQPFTFLDLLNVQPVNTDQVEYFQMNASTNNAAPVPEWDPAANAGAGGFGLKPESDLDFGMQTAGIITIATWIGASRQVLADVPRLRNILETEGRWMVRYAAEGQILNGSGVGNNLQGLRNTPGVLTRTHQTGARADVDDTIIDTFRRAITDVSLQGFPPTAILLHPYIAEEMELMKDTTTGQYLKIFDPVAQNVWRVPVVQAVRMPTDEAIVGAFSQGATVLDRQATEVRVGEPGDYFLRNAIAVLFELRIGLAVPRPKAFERVLAL